MKEEIDEANFEKNLKPIKHFDGDIPMDELLKIKFQTKNIKKKNKIKFQTKRKNMNTRNTTIN